MPAVALKEKTWVIAGTASALAAFLALFFLTADPVVRQATVYALPVVGLVFSFRYPWTIVAVNGLGLVLLCLVPSLSPWTRWGVSLLLAGTVPVPFHYYRQRAEERLRFREQCHRLLKASNGLQDELAGSETRRRVLEDRIEKINQLYVLGRELVEHMDRDAVLERLQRILLGRPGVRSVSLFLWEKNDWHAAISSDEENRMRWLDYLREHKSLRRKKRFRALVPPVWLRDQAVVFWPVYLERELLAGILLAVGEDDVTRFLEEGEIFTPQIALAVKRTRLFSEVQERSRNDGLTGLYLRRYFLERLGTEIQRARRYRSTFAVLMVDIDHFKHVNDTYGHPVGDAVLCSVARILVDCVRPGDLVGRYGGEEFVILLPMAARGGALRIASDIKERVACKEFNGDADAFRVTVSIGLSYYPSSSTRADELIRLADSALYWVKSHGRNGIRGIDQET